MLEIPRESFKSVAVKTSSFRKCGRVHITVSSFKEAYLELNWITDCDHPLDTPPSVIALFDKDPASNVNFSIFK